MDGNICARILCYATNFGRREGSVHAGRAVVFGQSVCGCDKCKKSRHEPGSLRPVYVVDYKAHPAQPGHLTECKSGRIDVQVMQSDEWKQPRFNQRHAVT